MFDRPLQAADRFGLSSKRIQTLYQQVDAWTRSGELLACAVSIARQGAPIEAKYAGRKAEGSDAPLVRRDALFLMASLTKPVTAIATMILVERGLITLDDPVALHIPEFAANGKGKVAIRHLLTHSSGLPDMLPQNIELRERHAVLPDFVQATCGLPLAFDPGTSVRYSSMGFVMLGELVERLTNTPLPTFLRNELFAPLGMENTSLGWVANRHERQLNVRLPHDQRDTDWHWNTHYWLGLGAPWGGLISTPTDYGRLMQMMLNGGYLGDVRVLCHGTVRQMTTNQLDALSGMPDDLRRLKPWGLGWRLHWPGCSQNFGDLLSPKFFGHWGSTGTLAWADPETDTVAVILTTEPQGDDGRYLARMSNMIGAAIQ